MAVAQVCPGGPADLAADVAHPCQRPGADAQGALKIQPPLHPGIQSSLGIHPPEGPALQHKAPLYDPVRCVPRGDTAQLRIDFLAHTAAPFPVVFPAFYQLFFEKSREY